MLSQRDFSESSRSLVGEGRSLAVVAAAANLIGVCTCWSVCVGGCAHVIAARVEDAARVGRGTGD